MRVFYVGYGWRIGGKNENVKYPGKIFESYTKSSWKKLKWRMKKAVENPQEG